MKKVGILNRGISEVIAGMGHLDMVVISDAGFPRPNSVTHIDLALKKGLPGFLETVEVIFTELKVERIIVAEELKGSSPEIRCELLKILEYPEIEEIPHEKLKQLSRNAVAVVRTGEFTPYANVILVSGVVFSVQPQVTDPDNA